MAILSQAKSKAHIKDNQGLLNEISSLDQLNSCTHLAIGAHPDDLEIMAAHGIEECYQKQDKNFVGVTCTNGAGSARSGAYKDFSDLEMQAVRRQEQMDSALLGDYGAILFFEFESSQIKADWNEDFINDLKTVITKLQPEAIYTHNPVDKHATHVGVCFHVVEALRQLDYKPQSFLASEVWRGLDWMSDEYKVPLSIKKPELISQLIACHRSQTEGGKKYAEATLGRMQANATFFESHQIDNEQHLWFNMDLLPLLRDKTVRISDFANYHLLKLINETHGHFKKFEPKE